MKTAEVCEKKEVETIFTGIQSQLVRLESIVSYQQQQITEQQQQITEQQQQITEHKQKITDQQQQITEHKQKITKMSTDLNFTLAYLQLKQEQTDAQLHKLKIYKAFRTYLLSSVNYFGTLQ